MWFRKKKEVEFEALTLEHGKTYVVEVKTKNFHDYKRARYCIKGIERKAGVRIVEVKKELFKFVRIPKGIDV
jgi:hypothetical protein